MSWSRHGLKQIVQFIPNYDHLLQVTLWGISWLAEWLSASQEELCCMDLVADNHTNRHINRVRKAHSYKVCDIPVRLSQLRFLRGSGCISLSSTVQLPVLDPRYTCRWWIRVFNSSYPNILPSNQLHWLESCLRSQYLLSWSRNSSSFMEPETPLKFSQDPATSLYLGSDESSP
jgi:hypothetical protein